MNTEQKIKEEKNIDSSERKISLKKAVLIVFVTAIATTIYATNKTIRTIEEELDNIAEI